MMYIWESDVNVWENKSIIQTALHCCSAIYENTPHAYFNRDETKLKHNITELKFVGDYSNEKLDNSTRFLVAMDSDGNMFIAFRGTFTIEDWKQNGNIGLSEDVDFGVGRFHDGFLNKATNINIGNLIQVIDVVAPKSIITTGHSMGGCISSLIHLKLLQRYTKDGELSPSQEFLNFTFGAPLFGNHVAVSFFNNNARDTNMFHFVNTADIVPAILSIGHVFKTLKKNSTLVSGLTDWVSKNKSALDIVDKCFNAALTFCGQIGIVQNLTIEAFLKNYSQLKDSLQNNSTLFKYYTDNDYVPIGNYIFLQKQQNARYECR